MRVRTTLSSSSLVKPANEPYVGKAMAGEAKARARVTKLRKVTIYVGYWGGLGNCAVSNAKPHPSFIEDSPCWCVCSEVECADLRTDSPEVLQTHGNFGLLQRFPPTELNVSRMRHQKVKCFEPNHQRALCRQDRRNIIKICSPRYEVRCKSGCVTSAGPYNPKHWDRFFFSIPTHLGTRLYVWYRSPQNQPVPHLLGER